MQHSNFNSIKVRLERIAQKNQKASVFQFQFHKGTIRTDLLPNYLQRFGNFNSIKVRLELRTWVTGQQLDIYFNSIKVRLEPYSPIA